MATSQKTILVTTSWDDGDCSDMRVAEALARHGLAGTFYLPVEPFRAGRELSLAQVRELTAGSFEIGGHTVSHRSLPELSAQDQQREISDCKRVWEERLGRAIESFCYPNGRFNGNTVRHVEQAGYRGARTTRMLRSSLQFSRFEMPTTLQAYPHPARAYLRNGLKGKNLSGLSQFALSQFALNAWRARNWVELGKAWFDRALENGGVWHLYGHSWELDQLNLWGELEQLLSYIAQRLGVQYVTNAGVCRFTTDRVTNDRVPNRSGP